MQMEVTCRCGWITHGSRTTVIKAVQEHARTMHNLTVTPNEVRAIWRVVEDDAHARRQPNG